MTAARPIHTIAVLGAGTMGHGIAQVAAAAGYVVTAPENLEAMRMVEQGGGHCARHRLRDGTRLLAPDGACA